MTAPLSQLLYDWGQSEDSPKMPAHYQYKSCQNATKIFFHPFNVMIFRTILRKTIAWQEILELNRPGAKRETIEKPSCL